jgi:hypothetical protein
MQQKHGQFQPHWGALWIVTQQQRIQDHLRALFV